MEGLPNITENETKEMVTAINNLPYLNDLSIRGHMDNRWVLNEITNLHNESVTKLCLNGFPENFEQFILSGFSQNIKDLTIDRNFKDQKDILSLIR